MAIDSLRPRALDSLRPVHLPPRCVCAMPRVPLEWLVDVPCSSYMPCLGGHHIVGSLFFERAAAFLPKVA